ncbi:MAG TPA: alpha/beta hydrolase [Anaerolineae bacterium]
MPIYKNYDKAALDDQYNNRAKVPNFEAIVQGWRDDSERVRQQLDGEVGVAYGPNEREYLDIFPAAQPDSPVHIFFHGGYWHSLDTSLFDFVAAGFVEHGVTTVLVNYPLTPLVRMDKLIAACRRAMIWLYRHIANYNGDPQQLYISGHSAGGHIVAMLMATMWREGADDVPEQLVKGGCAISGLFNLRPIQLSYVNDSIGMDEVTARRNSPVFMTPTTRRPLIVAVGGAESEEYKAQSQELAAAWSGQLALTELTVAGANHFTVLASLAQPNGALHRAILGQMGLELA